MIDQHLVNLALSEIDDLERAFQNNQGMILTENDLKCQLFSKLKMILPLEKTTFNPPINGSPLHSELKFFDEKNKLSLVPDITIISPENLSIFHSIEFKINNEHSGFFNNYSSKSYEFGGSAILIELKFCRNKTGLSDKIIGDCLKDIHKIKRLQQLVINRSNHRDQFFGICAIFNKTDIGRMKFDALFKDNNNHINIQLLYKSGRVDYKYESLR